MTPRFMLAVLAALAAAPASAQTSYAPEDYAVIQAGERASFDSQSVRTLGELTRFEVLITAKGAQDRPVGSPAKRLIRYVAKCKSGEMALAAVSLIDDNGRMLKSMTVPPGGGDYVKPDAGTPQAEWIAKACEQ